MLMPAIAQLNVSADIVLVGRSPGIDFISPYVNRSIDYEGSGWYRLFLEKRDVTHTLDLPEADLVVAFLSDPWVREQEPPGPHAQGFGPLLPSISARRGKCPCGLVFSAMSSKVGVTR